MNLNSIVKPNMNISRSINLDRDYRQEATIKDYHVTAKTLEILSRFADSLEGEKVNAWSLTGPYGMGKSAFVNYLLTLTGPQNDSPTVIALEKLKQSNKPLYNRLAKGLEQVGGQAGFLRLPITAAYEPANISLARGLYNAIKSEQFKNKSKIMATLNHILQSKAVESGDLFAVFQNVRDSIDMPMVIVIDEFGKNLDYMSTHHDRGDIFIMQQLAEMSSVYLWVCLHQAFDGYASGLSALQRHEWSKVQGRFEDISFVESTSQMLSLIRKTLIYNVNGEYKVRLENWADNVYNFIHNTNIVGKKDLNYDNILNIYPLHPVTAIALIELCTRFAQNDRTLLSFMCNGERYALSTFLERTTIEEDKELPAVGLDYLYDYFFNISVTAYLNRAESQRWIEIQDIIDQNGELLDVEEKILKSIGVLNLLSGSLGLKATSEIITSVINQTTGLDKKLIEEKLANLVNRGILLYREYAGEYRLWEGSDFNVYQAITDRKEKLEIGELHEILQKYLPLYPVIASRHSYKTGTVRRFERKWMAEENLNENIAPQEGFDGLFLYCFGTLKEPTFVPKICADGRPIIIAYTPSQSTLHELALEVAAARSVLDESPELKHDSVARKEIKYRIKVAEEHFRSFLEQIYTPGSEKVTWYSEGIIVPITNTKMLSATLSDLCDSYYHKCPPVRNEMISYEKLSSAATRARRELIEAMVTKEREENLGLKGFGPEVAIFKTLLQYEGLHVKDEQTGYWRFTLIGRNKSKYEALWSEIDQCLDEAAEKGITVEDIIARLKAPPFGLRQGPAPIYICLYLIVCSDNIAVFQEGTYRPYLSASVAALLIKRPDLFTIKKYIFTDLDRAVFNTYESILKTARIEGITGLRNTTLLSVVGPLVKFVEDLPAYTKKTRQISKEARQVRLAIQNSVDPARLIFEDLPKAVGVNLKDKDSMSLNKQLEKRLKSALYELQQAFPNLKNKVRKTMLNVFACDTLETLYEIQRNKIIPLVEICDDWELKPILFAFKRDTLDAAEWVNGIAGRVMGKPIDSWNDSDLATFESRLHDYADRINHLGAIASVKTKSIEKGSRVISMMMPDGSFRRAIVAGAANDSEIIKKAKEIIANATRDQAKAILVALAEELLEDI
ncbi:MAG TPA: hypothetical protein PK033_10940 [Acetivibrio sp.]|nr:hypothetical protein [Acetivibrio sp.]